MCQRLFHCVAVSSLSFLVGCGSQSTTGSSAGGPMPTDPASRVVYEFLDAIRSADAEKASSLLTPLSLERTREAQLAFAPPGSPTARFRVGAMEMVDSEKAVVESVWIDLDADGKPYEEKTTWALKRSNGQWRIRGMAADRGPNQEPMVEDFEDPESMIEYAKSTEPAGINTSAPRQAAQTPKDPFLATPR